MLRLPVRNVPWAGWAVVGCLAPFAAGAAMPVADHQLAAPGLPCPFAAATGLPCPLCGSSRAFALLMHGDGAWARYNLATVAFSALAVLGALLALAAPRSADRAWRALGRRGLVAVALAVLAVTWLWAIRQRAWIV